MSEKNGNGEKPQNLSVVEATKAPRSEFYDAGTTYEYRNMDIKQRIWLFTEKFEGVEKSREGVHGSMYFNIDDIYNAAVPIMRECGIGAVDLIQTIATSDGQSRQELWIVVFCLDWPDNNLTSNIPLPEADGQAFGSEVTYKRRYGLVTMLNICVPGDDDDGFQAEMLKRANELGSAQGEPLQKLRELIDQMEGDGIGRTLEHVEKIWGIVTLEELTLKQCASLTRTIKDILAKEAKGGTAKS